MSDETLDFAAMDDRTLAKTLYEADTGEDVETLVFAENEIAERLNLSLDDTEQGFTVEANRKVAEYVFEHYPEAAGGDA